MDKELFNLGFSYELGCGLGLLSQFLPLSKNSKLNLRFKEELSSEYSNGFSLTNGMYKQYFQSTNYSLVDINNFMNKSIFIGFNQGQSIGWEYLHNINERITHKLSQLRINRNDLNEHMFATNGIINNIELLYFQCNFSNPYGNRVESEKNKYNKEILNIGFDVSVEENTLEKYSRKGEFLNADNMAVFKVNGRAKKGLHILVIDNNFSIGNVVNINSIEDVFFALKRESYKNMKKSNFSFISTEYHSTYDVDVASEIIQYADTLHDSSLMKMIQSGSYAYSLLNFLKQNNKYIGEDIYVTLIGLKDNDFSIMKMPTFKLSGEVTLEDLMKFYEKCSKCNMSKEEDNEIKRLEKLSKGYKAWERIPAGQIADKVRLENTIHLKDRMINVLKSDTNINISDILELNTLRSELKYIVLNESLDNFVSTVNEVREDHGNRIIDALEKSENPILVCNGSPGIGKTTSLRNSSNRNDKFLLMYFSPRTALGDDLEEKFKVDRDNKYVGYLPSDVICLTASSKDPESKEEGKMVVRYSAENKPSESNKIDYINRKERSLFDSKKDSFKCDSDRNITFEQENQGGAYKRVCKAVDELLGKGEYNKIVTTLTLQACKKINTNDSKRKQTTVEHLRIVFPFIKNGVTATDLVVDEFEYRKFCKRTQNVYIMIDEITGSEEGKALYSEIKKIVLAPLEKYYSRGKEKLLNFKLVIADASLVNSDVIKDYLESENNIQSPKIYVTDGDCNNAGVYSETISLNLASNVSVNADVVNANCYPAKKLNIRYKILNMSKKIDAGEKDNGFYDEVRAYEDKTIVSECIKDIEKGVQSIIYIQHIKRLDNIVAALKKEATIRNISMVEGIDYIVINSNLDDKQRRKIIEYNNEQNDIEDDKRSLKVILMTSSASRGISFKKAEKLHCVVQDYNIEPAFMEIIQYIYRPRGNDDRDRNGIKCVDFYLRNVAYYGSEHEKELAESRSLISVASLILLLRGCVFSRINGYVGINGSPISIVPLGGTGLNGVNISIYEDIKKAIKEIRSDMITSKRKDFDKLLDFLMKVFSASTIIIDGVVFNNEVDGKNVYRDFVDTIQKDLFKILFFRKFNDFYYYNGMMIFPMHGEVTDMVHMLKDEVMKYRKNGGFILDILNDENVKDVIRKPLTFIASLMEFDIATDSVYSNSLTEIGNVENRFLTIPLQSFIYYGDIEEFVYEKDEKETFGKVIESMIRGQINPYGVMPIVPTRYKNYPFITFKSNDFIIKRRNMFDFEYVMTSTELNMVNLLFIGNRK